MVYLICNVLFNFIEQKVVKAQSVDGLPSGYVRFLLDLDGKPGARRHGFEMEGTLTTKGYKAMNLNQLGVLYAKTKERYFKWG